ncbi:signal recognition particle 9 kDa protein [Entelurus aequoreus]|uniref:signal recognition particle 9 kDa protein n=2 Tax=Syngnathinae TaxID=129914 RepID=UPI002B1E6153|nr:signal recognition particle 9 kDa protein [Entelurus aequoreus]
MCSSEVSLAVAPFHDESFHSFNLIRNQLQIMPYFRTWEDFARAAEKLYLTEPMKARVVLKYRHCDGNLCIKVTDNAVCLQYKTDQAQDVKKIEKLHGKLMRLMVSKETHSGAMETD